jgi:nucleoside-diphosphate-sugar epimerase
VETFALFRTAQQAGVLPVFDPAARIALIHVKDAAAQIAYLTQNPMGRIVALSDDRPAGYGWREIAEAAGAAVGRSPHLVRLPDSVLSLIGVVGAAGRLLGGTPMLTPGKARELRHLDWSVASHERPAALPAPRYGLLEGFKQTVEWYRQAGWLARC